MTRVLERSFPPVAPAEQPGYFTRFVGRAEDLARLSELFARGERLVTVTGPGGIGKTRLSYEFVARS